ncbi:MAG: hypothetical protein HY608_10870, partial [Planctomycetes bacterium]|nr:hypothetical protein [Planctomycetota bacterium]
MRSWGMRHVPASVLLLLAGGCARYQEAVPVPGPAPVALTQHRAAPFGEAVETEGFFVGFGQRLALAEEELAGSFSYAGREYRFQVGAEVPANPALRLDSDGDGDPSNDAPLPDSAYPSRSEGYLQALIEPVPGQPLRLVCVFKGGHFRALLCARSSWRGEAHVDGRTVGVVA